MFRLEIIDHDSLQTPRINILVLNRRQFDGTISRVEIAAHRVSPRHPGKTAELQQLFEIRVIDGGGQTVVFDADGCGLADNLTDHATGPHHPDHTQRLMRHTDVSAGREQIFDIARIEAAIRQRVAATTVHAFSVLPPSQ